MKSLIRLAAEGLLLFGVVVGTILWYAIYGVGFTLLYASMQWQKTQDRLAAYFRR